MATKNSTERTRNYACILYEESAPNNWLDILRDTHVQFLISPLHDQDVEPSGEPKKPHRHIVVMFDGVKTQKQAKEVFALVNGVGAEVVRSLRGYARYLCHLDSPEKARYSEDGIIALNGAAYHDLVATKEDEAISLANVIRYIRDNEIDCIADLIDMHLDNPRLLIFIRNNTAFLSTYVKSRYWKANIRNQISVQKKY